MKLLEELKVNIKKFSFGELTSNVNGKTSASSTMGCLVTSIGSLVFLISAFTKNIDLINQSVIMTTLGCGLLGYNKSQEKFTKPLEETLTTEVKDEQISEKTEEILPIPDETSTAIK